MNWGFFLRGRERGERKREKIGGEQLTFFRLFFSSFKTISRAHPVVVSCSPIFSSFLLFFPCSFQGRGKIKGGAGRRWPFFFLLRLSSFFFKKKKKKGVVNQKTTLSQKRILLNSIQVFLFCLLFVFLCCGSGFVVPSSNGGGKKRGGRERGNGPRGRVSLSLPSTSSYALSRWKTKGESNQSPFFAIFESISFSARAGMGASPARRRDRERRGVFLVFLVSSSFSR